MNDLVLCTSCTRHVRRTEERCPFCGTTLAVEVRRARPPVASPGLSRAKLYAFHAAVATSVAASACGGSLVVTNDAGNAGDARTGDASSSDGQSVVDAANDSATQGDASTESSTIAESGADTSIHDSGSDGDGWGPPPPPYGCVFPEGCGDVKV
jgi:hypothetical protein